jgi:SAM-dependent methyltransferase
MAGFYSTIARYYDAEHTDKTDDLAMYSRLAEEYGDPILDVGCGTGRVMFHLAQEGHTTHGIDSEYDMLERAKMRLDVFGHVRDKLMFYQGDVLTYDIEKRFKLVLLSYNALMHFHTQEEQLVLMRRERTFIDPETGHMIMQQATSYLDRVQQLMHVTWIYDEINEDGVVQRTVAPVIFRYFFFPELSLLLTHTGFVVDEVYGDTDLSPFEDGCERMIVVARPV